MKRIVLFALLLFAPSAWAAVVNIDCPPGSSWAWNPATSTLACTAGVVTPPPVDPPPSQPPTGSCPAGTLWIKGQWGNTGIDTGQFGDFGNNIMVVQIDVPTNWASTTTKLSSWAEYAAGQTVRQAVASTVPCDFGNANALKTSTGMPASSVGRNDISFGFRYKLGAPGTTVVGFQTGKTYYINMKNSYSSGQPSCTIANCRMIGGLPQ